MPSCGRRTTSWPFDPQPLLLLLPLELLQQLPLLLLLLLLELLGQHPLPLLLLLLLLLLSSLPPAEHVTAATI